MRKDDYYDDEDELEELERQREIIEKKIRRMSADDGYGSGRSSASGRSKSSSSSGKVKRVSAQEVDSLEHTRRASYRTGSSTAYRSSSSQRGRVKKKKKKKRRAKRFFRRFIIAVILIAAILIGSIYYMLSGLTRTELEGDLAASDGVSYIKNIALYGVDTRDSDSTSGLSDAIMIMSVNKRTGEIKLISVLRDSMVYVDGYGDLKINAAYSYGGASLAVKTLNENFSLDITDYITVNFAQLAAIIDAAGGVTLEITAAEAEQINKNLDDAAQEDMTVSDIEYVEVADQTVLLNGDQAVAYSRIRKIDSDNARAGRQQKVLSALLENIKSMPVWKYPAFIHEFLSVSESSLSNAEIMSFAPLIFKSFTISTYTVPDADYETDLTSGYNSSSQWCWFYDLDNAAERIHSIIYE